MDPHIAFRRAAVALIVVATAGSLAGCAGATSDGAHAATAGPIGAASPPGPGAQEPIGSDRPDPAATPGSSSANVGTSGGFGPPDGSAPPGSTTPPTPAAPAPASAPPATPAPTPSPTLALDPPPTAGPFGMDLYRKGDFVTEKMPIWCAPAALQTMINIMSPGADTTRKTQKLLHAIARKLGPAPDKGSEPEGEAKTLSALGYGPYAVLVTKTRSEAFRAAARAIRLTGRPAALLVWRGAHNWVVSGFRSTADPALGGDFRVTHLRIEDVWYPRVSNIWGASRPPDALVPVRSMPEDYLPWRRPTGRYPGKDGRFVLIIPVPAS